MFKLFRNANVLQADLSVRLCDLIVQNDLIYDLVDPGTEINRQIDTQVDLEEQYVFPGMINSHDHLINTCWKPACEGPFDNWYEWVKAVKSSEEHKLLQKLSVTDLYIIGMYKNIISGATVVVDHFPSEVSATFFNHPLTSLLENFLISHSVSRHKLHWSPSIQEQIRRAKEIPFLVHAGEGKSKEIQEEVLTLKRLNALSANTVLANCTFLSESDLEMIGEAQASIVWLPTSSSRVLGQNPNIGKILDLGISLTIGTDSSISGSQNMLGELKAAYDYSKTHLNGRLSAKDIVRMATIEAAKIWGISKHHGDLNPGKRADFVVFRGKESEDVFYDFITNQPEDFSMVVHRGTMISGNDEYRRMSSIDFSLYSEVKINGVSKILYGRPLELLGRVRHKLDRMVNFPFFNITPEG